MSAPGRPRAVDVILRAGFGWPWMLARPVAAGVAYGLATWAAMNYVVVPLPRASAPPFIPAWFVDGLLAHVLLVGLLFAFAARRSALRGRFL